MLYLRTPLVYVVTMKMSPIPPVSSGRDLQLLFPRLSWCGCFTLLFPSFVARASCCACECAIGLAG